MESNNQFSQEVPSESSAITASAPDNSTNQELEELELDAIAGGMAFFDRSRLQWYAPTERIPTEDFFISVAGKKVG